MELAPRKIIVLLLILIVLVISWNSISNLVKTSKSGISSINEMKCKETPILVENEYYNCDLNKDLCSEDEIKKWEDAKKYLGNKNCDVLDSDDNKKNDCSCIQKIIYNLKNNNLNVDINGGNIVDGENLNLDLSKIDSDYRSKFSGKLSPAFFDKVEKISSYLGTKPEYLIAVMNFETGGTFDPCEKNNIGAVGLIQFTKSTADDLGTTTDKLCTMSRLEQLDYVYKYLKQYKGKISTLNDLYMAVFLPSMVGKPENYVISKKGDKYYNGNSGLDKNKDDKIIVGEAISAVITNYG